MAVNMYFHEQPWCSWLTVYFRSVRTHITYTQNRGTLWVPNILLHSWIMLSGASCSFRNSALPERSSIVTRDSRRLRVADLLLSVGRLPGQRQRRQTSTTVLLAFWLPLDWDGFICAGWALASDPDVRQCGTSPLHHTDSVTCQKDGGRLVRPSVCFGHSPDRGKAPCWQRRGLPHESSLLSEINIVEFPNGEWKM